jgi:hypothetical protein
MIIETASMSWQLALTDPQLMRLGDWLAQQHGEEGMAWLEEEEGVSRWDLEGWQTEDACRSLNVVFVKDPEGQVRPFVQEEQPVQQETIQVIFNFWLYLSRVVRWRGRRTGALRPRCPAWTRRPARRRRPR